MGGLILYKNRDCQNQSRFKSLNLLQKSTQDSFQVRFLKSQSKVPHLSKLVQLTTFLTDRAGTVASGHPCSPLLSSWLRKHSVVLTSWRSYGRDLLDGPMTYPPKNEKTMSMARGRTVRYSNIQCRTGWALSSQGRCCFQFDSCWHVQEKTFHKFCQALCRRTADSLLTLTGRVLLEQYIPPELLAERDIWKERSKGKVRRKESKEKEEGRKEGKGKERK